MSTEIYMHVRKCPICRKKLVEFKKRNSYGCKNKCYVIQSENTFLVERVFDEAFTYFNDESEEEIKKVQEKINRKIKYWKKNDRYLMKIMEG